MADTQETLIPELNINVDLPITAEGKPNTDPLVVVKFAQQLLLKAVLEKTNNGTYVPSDTKEVAALTRDLVINAQTTRKLDMEEKNVGNREAMVEAFKTFMEMADGQDIHNPKGVSKARDPYKDISPPDIQVRPEELSQGEALPNPDDFLSS